MFSRDCREDETILGYYFLLAGRGNQLLIDDLYQLLFRAQTGYQKRIAFEGYKNHQRYAAYVEQPSQFSFFVRIYLVNLDFVAVVLLNIGENRGQPLARAAPSGIQVYNNRFFPVEFPLLVFIVIPDLVFEFLCSEFFYCLAVNSQKKT